LGADTFLAHYARNAGQSGFRSLRYIVAGAEAVKAETRRLYTKKFGLRILEGYGVTEASPVIAVNAPAFNKVGTVGRLLPFVEPRLEPVPAIEEGSRLIVRGPNIMLGYYRADNPGEIEPPPGGSHDTGDIVAIDSQGFVAIKGRAKRFAKIAGETVSLASVEDLVAGLWPDHVAAAIAALDPKRGERVILATTNPGDAGRGADLDEDQRRVRNHAPLVDRRPRGDPVSGLRQDQLCSAGQSGARQRGVGRMISTPAASSGRLVSVARPCEVWSAEKTEENSAPISLRETLMVRMVTRLIAVALFALSLPLAVQAKTFYWISHGSPADPVWTYFLSGAESWAKDTGQTVKTSFHNGDVPSQQEAIRAAIAAKADAIVTTSPDPGSLVDVVKEARAAGIPVVNFNTPDAKVNFNAYVGGDLAVVGKGWAQYLVDHNLVKSGDFVWLPVEVPGASYGVEEEKAIATVFKPLNITWEVTDNTLDQANVISRMSDYLTANRKKIKAIIGLGDLVTGSIKRVFDQVGVKPGEIPVVGWGNSRDTTAEVLGGYVNAAEWQDPQATSYMALSVANMATSGIPPGFNITVGTLYDKTNAALYDKIMSGK
jgi:simple sugar transport system substrate-binding protein